MGGYQEKRPYIFVDVPLAPATDGSGPGLQAATRTGQVARPMDFGQALAESQQPVSVVPSVAADNDHIGQRSPVIPAVRTETGGGSTDSSVLVRLDQRPIQSRFSFPTTSTTILDREEAFALLESARNALPTYRVSTAKRCQWDSRRTSQKNRGRR